MDNKAKLIGLNETILSRQPEPADAWSNSGGGQVAQRLPTKTGDQTQSPAPGHPGSRNRLTRSRRGELKPLRLPPGKLSSRSKTASARNSPGEERSLLDLPIYRCTNEQYELEQRQRSLQVSHDAIPGAGDSGTAGIQSASDERQPATHWRYNEILGWLRLWARGSVVCGDLYLSKARRMSGRQKRMFKRLTRAFEITLDGRASNEEISSKLFVELESLAEKPPVRDRFLDLSVLRNLAPVLNWRRLFGME